MDAPSPYQSDFFSALNLMGDVDLQVRYFGGVSSRRAKEGWGESHELLPFEKSVGGVGSALEMVSTVQGWKERIHIISMSFSCELVDFFCSNGVAWCHWSETPGFALATMLGYRMGLFRALRPIAHVLGRRKGRKLSRHSLGVFVQGVLAASAFKKMGVPDEKMADLYYSPAAVAALPPRDDIVAFARGRRAFLSVGALCHRKGTDLLLRAFSALGIADWCLVLCGLDKEPVRHHAMVRKLGLEENVMFLGSVSSDHIGSVYAASDVFVLASRFDGWGVVLNEAASAGMPLIATEMCGAAWHLISEGVNGFRVRAASVDALKAAMLSYTSCPELVDKHGSHSRALFSRDFTPEQNAVRLVAGINRFEASNGH